MPRDRRFAFGLLTSVLMVSSAAAQQSGVRWQYDIESAKSAARQSGRLVLVHVWTEECAPCAALEQNVFNQPGVANALEMKFVPVKLNANEFPGTAQGFGITKVPTDVVLTPEGQVLGKMISAPTPSAYLAELNQVANQYAGQSGTPYQNAVANAQQSMIPNQAYASLQINTPTPQPAAPQPQAATPPAAVGNPYAAAENAGAGVANVGQPAAAMPSVSPAPTSNPAMTPALGANPYAPLQNTTTSTPPSAITNQYATGQAPAPTASTSPTTPAVPDLRQLPAGAPPLGFEGFCPVSMRTSWNWVPGDPKWGAIHRGRTYWFAGPREQQQFLANPDYYSPALAGVDPVMAIDHRQSVQGLREHSLDYDNQFYFFSSEATLQQFTANPERYANGVRQAMGLPPTGRQVR